MKRLLAWVLLAGGGGLSAEEGFWQQLTAEERAAAGIEALSPVQRAELDRLAGRFAREGARAAAAAATASVKEGMRAEVRAEAKAEVEREVRKSEESKFGLTGGRGHAEAIRSRIAGTFRGWTGRTLFRLENGQVWVQADGSDVYWLPPQPGPEVEIRESGFGGWKLFLLPNERWVRVKRVN